MCNVGPTDSEGDLRKTYDQFNVVGSSENKCVGLGDFFPHEFTSRRVYLMKFVC